MGVPAFSVVVTARNEARTLPELMGTLGAFRSAGGEIIVVDTGSDDETIRVARDAGARVEAAGSRFHSVVTEEQAATITARFARHAEGPLVQSGQSLFDFGRAREFASRLASNDFVWHIDGSDVVESIDLAFLDAQVRSGLVNGFYYVVRLGTASFRVFRFFDRRLYAWRGRVHEVPMATRAPMPGSRITCSEDQLSLRHNRHEKVRNYLAGLALEVLDDASTPRWKYYLGRELYYERRYRSAMAVLREHVRMKTAWHVERADSLRLVGACLEALGRSDAAAESYFRSARVDPSRREPLLKLALLCQRRGDFQGSIAFAAAALTVPRTGPFIDAEEHYTSDPHAILYWGLFWLGRREEAKGHWETCRCMAPANEKFREDARLFADADRGVRRPEASP